MYFDINVVLSCFDSTTIETVSHTTASEIRYKVQCGEMGLANRNTTSHYTNISIPFKIEQVA